MSKENILSNKPSVFCHVQNTPNFVNKQVTMFCMRLHGTSHGKKLVPASSDLAYTVACHVTMSCTRLHATPHGKKLVPHDSESSYMTLLTNALTLGTLLARSPGAWKGSISSITFYFTVGSDESA